jgi:hypothetical protein
MSFQAMMEELLERAGASRTALRLDDRPGTVFPAKGDARPAGRSCPGA